jgi:hypothetical protein
MEFNHSFNALTKHIEREIFVGRMDSVAFKSEAHKDGFDTENTLKVADNGDGASAANG